MGFEQDEGCYIDSCIQTNTELMHREEKIVCYILIIMFVTCSLNNDTFNDIQLCLSLYAFRVFCLQSQLRTHSNNNCACNLRDVIKRPPQVRRDHFWFLRLPFPQLRVFLSYSFMSACKSLFICLKISDFCRQCQPWHCLLLAISSYIYPIHILPINFISFDNSS